jgi:hypothetical protein
MRLESLPPKSLVTLRVLWAAITCSTMVFLLVLTVVERPPQPLNPVLLPAFAAVSLGCIAVGILLPQKALRMGHSAHAPLAAYQTAAILGLALTEAVALFGFVLGFLGFAPTSFGPFFGAAWVVFVLRFPRATHPLGLLGPALGRTTG